MNVVVISEDNHGRIGVALNYYNAVKWLIDAAWIDDDTEVYDYDTDEWRTVKEVLGADWASLMLNDENWNLDRFNDFWGCCFSLTPRRSYWDRGRIMRPLSPAPGQKNFFSKTY